MASEFENRIELGATKISKSDLESAFKKFEALVKRANSKIPEEKSNYSISLGHNIEKVSGKTWLDSEFYSNAPNISTEMHAEYRTFVEDAPISSITFSFYHHKREITVKGYDSAQVFAFTTVAKETFKNHNVILGGFGINSTLTILCFLAVYLFFILSAKLTEKWQQILAGFLGIIFAILYGYLMFSENKAFPGFVFYQQSASFIERYGAQVGFWASILGILGFFSQLRDFFKGNS